MPNRLRFYLDENVNHEVARGLQTRDIDVITTPEAGTMGKSDEEHLAYALSENRVVVTQDGDFCRMHYQGKSHAGIAYYEPQTRTVKQIIRMLILMYDVYSSDEMMNRIEYL